MKLLTLLLLIVGLLVQHVFADGQSAVMGVNSDMTASQSSSSDWYLERNCRRRVALAVRDFAKEQLAQTPRPVGYLVSSVGINRWIQSLQLVPDMIPKNAEIIEKYSPAVSALLKEMGTGDVSRGLSKFVDSVGVVGVKGKTADSSLEGFFALGGQDAQNSYDVCLVRSFSMTPLGKDACHAYETTGEAGLKLLSIKLFTTSMRKSALGQFAIRYGGLHGIAKKDAKFITRLSHIISHTRFGALISRIGGFGKLLDNITRGSHGLEAVAWNLYGPKLWEKVSQCQGGTGLELARRSAWKSLVSLNKNTVYIPHFPASRHYTFQFWIKPHTTIPEWGSILHHGDADHVRGPAVWTCRNSFGLHIRQDTVKSDNEGIECSAPLPVNQCTLVTLMNRNGELRLYYNDQMVQKAILGASKHIEGPVYFSNPWATPANAAVMPVTALTRAMTESEIERSIAHSYSVCGNDFPKDLATRFSAISQSERVAVHEMRFKQGHSDTSLLDQHSEVNEASEASTSVDAFLLAAQRDTCLFRLNDVAIQQFSTAIQSSPIASVFGTYNNDLQSFLNAGIRGEIDIAALQQQVASTKLGSSLASVGGLPALIEAYSPVDNSSTPGALTKQQIKTAAWGRVQNLVFKLGGGKLDHALHRCTEQVHLNLESFQVDKAISSEACGIVANWGRTALPGYGLQLFERALVKSRIGHLYKHYSGLDTLAAMMRSNPELEGKVGGLLYQTELGAILAKAAGSTGTSVTDVQKGFSALLTATLTGPSALLAHVNSAIGDKVQQATTTCADTTPVQQVRSRCRQRTVRRAIHDFYRQLDQSPMKPHLLAAFTSSPFAQFGAVYTPAVGLEALAKLPRAQLAAVEHSLENSNLNKLILPVGGLSALVRATRTHADMQQLVWRLFKVQLLPDVDRCVSTIAARTAAESSFVEQCRNSVRDFYTNRFYTDLNASLLGKFMTKFGGIGGIARHSGDLLNRLSSLMERAATAEPLVTAENKKPVPSVASRIQRVGGLIVVLETVRRDSSAKSLNDLVLDMYGSAAQVALDHCETNAGHAAVASTTNFLAHLKGKLADPAFKRILDRFLLNAHRPFVKNVLGQELDSVRGLKGLIAASADGNDSDLNAYIQARLGGANMKQSALYPFLQSMGMASGLRQLGRDQGAKLQSVVHGLKCKIVDKTWLTRVFNDMGGCDNVMDKVSNPPTGAVADPKVMSLLALDELSQSKLRRPLVESGLNGLLGHKNQFDESIMSGDGRLESSIRAAMLQTFAFEHGEGHASAMKDMVAKIVDKMQKKQVETERSLIESAVVDTAAVSTEPTEAAAPLELPATATMEDVAKPAKKVINSAPAHCINQCSGRGKCVQNTGKQIPAPSGETFLHPYECICDLGWTGTGCEIMIDEFVRFLMSRGAYEMPKCCNVCNSQAQVQIDARFVPASAANPPEIDPSCSTPDWISNPALRSKCVRQVLQARSRFLPSADNAVTTSFVELGTSVSPFESASNAAVPSADLAAVERMFDATMAPKVASPSTSFVEGSTNAVYPNSAAARFPKQTAAQRAAALERENQAKFAAIHGSHAPQKSVRLGSFLSLAQANGMNEDPPHLAKDPIGFTGEPVAADAVSTEALHNQEYDTSFLHEPQDLSQVKVEPCCVPCDQYPDPIKPKMPVQPHTELSIMEQLKRKKQNPHYMLPHENSVADNLAIAEVLSKKGLPVDNQFKRRGPVSRTGSYQARAADPNYVRRSLRGPLPSEEEEKKSKDQEGCCNYCPYKRVPGLPWKKVKQEVTPASFLEEDVQVLERIDDGIVSFMEESFSMLAQTRAGASANTDLGTDDDLEEEQLVDTDALADKDFAGQLDGILAGQRSSSFADVGSDQEAMVASEMDMENDVEDADRAANESINDFRIGADEKAVFDVQDKLNMWWTNLQRSKNQTFPQVPNASGVDLRVFKGGNDNSVPFLPKLPKVVAGCCNICPSVFSLRRTPNDPFANVEDEY